MVVSGIFHALKNLCGGIRSPEAFSSRSSYGKSRPGYWGGQDDFCCASEHGQIICRNGPTELPFEDAAGDKEVHFARFVALQIAETGSIRV